MQKSQEIPQKSGIKWSMGKADIYGQKSINIYRETADEIRSKNVWGT